MRVFAGPNGSGKTTIINSVKEEKVNGKPIDFGTYINADVIAQCLLADSFSFVEYGLKDISKSDVIARAQDSGLVENETSANNLFKDAIFSKSGIKLNDKSKNEPIAQILADYLRMNMLAAKSKFSFETVFSHKGKVELMEKATASGYKVYLYFVGTESPEINKFRVLSRVRKGGHNVPPEKIESRYYRSMKLLKKASNVCYQAFFFDNSKEHEDFSMFAHFKVVKGEKIWDDIDWDKVPTWFYTYYNEES